MWNLKNTSKINDFKELKSINFADLDSKLYCMITTIKGNRFVFDLSKVYTPIPNTLNEKEFDVSPDNHKILIGVNKGASDIRSFLANPPKEDDDNQIGINQSTGKKEEPEEEEEVNAEVVEEVIEEHNSKSEEEITEEEEEKKDEIITEFEQNILDKMKDKGLDVEEDDNKSE